MQGTPEDEGVVVFGLYLDGAALDMKICCLTESLPGQRFFPLPKMRFIPVQIKVKVRDSASTLNR